MYKTLHETCSSVQLKEEREAWLKREGKYVYQIEHLKKSVREVLDREAKATAAS